MINGNACRSCQMGDSDVLEGVSLKQLLLALLACLQPTSFRVNMPLTNGLNPLNFCTHLDICKLLPTAERYVHFFCTVA